MNLEKAFKQTRENLELFKLSTESLDLIESENQSLKQRVAELEDRIKTNAEFHKQESARAIETNTCECCGRKGIL